MKKFLSPVAATFIKQKQIIRLPIYLHAHKTLLNNTFVGKRFYAKRVTKKGPGFVSPPKGPSFGSPPKGSEIQSQLPVLNYGEVSSKDLQNLLLERMAKKEEAKGDPEKYRHLSYSLFRAMAAFNQWLVPVMHEQQSETIQPLKKDSDMVLIEKDGIKKKRILPIFTSMDLYENCKKLQNENFGKSVEKLDNIALLAPGLDEIIVDMGSPHEFVLEPQFVQVLPSWRSVIQIEQVLREIADINEYVLVQLKKGDKASAKAAIRDMDRRNLLGIVKRYNPYFIISLGNDPNIANSHIMGLAPNEYKLDLAAVFTAPDTALEYTRIMCLEPDVIQPVSGEFLFKTVQSYDTLVGICFNRFHENPAATNRELVVSRDFISLVNEAD